MRRSQARTALAALVAGMAVAVGIALTAPAAAAAATRPDGAAASASASASASLYATPGGSGSTCSKAKPCSAKTAVTQAVKNLKYIEMQVTVHLARGTYHEALNANYLPPNDAKSLTIEGASAATTVVDAGGKAPALTVGVDTPQVTVQGVEFTGGKGGGVADGGGDVTLVDTLVTGNKATLGAGIADSGGKVVVESSEIDGNTAKDSGGGIVTTGGSVTVTNSDIAGNGANGGIGGGIYAEDATLAVRDSTIWGNLAQKSTTGTGSGGAIAVVAVAGSKTTATVIGSTLAFNQAIASGGAIWSSDSNLKYGADIIADNQAGTGGECAASNGGSFADLGYNVLDDSTCPHGASTKVATDSAIGVQPPLSRNGGPTITGRIGKTSAAHFVVPVDAKLAGQVFCAGTDQRGAQRHQGPAKHCDAGAYQFAPPRITGVSPGKARPGTTITISGYGFDFVSLTFGSKHPAFSVNAAQTRITVSVPAPAGTQTITLTNADGTASRAFLVTG
jgi:hypothetical protein